MVGNARFWVVVLVFVAAISLNALAANPDAVVLTRTIVSSGGGYAPGGTIDIKLSISRTGSSSITALGLEEWLPAGWSYVGIVSGATPDIKPAEGKEDLLEFAWFPFSGSYPVMPFNVTYRVAVPANATGVQVLTGHVLYRAQGVSGEQQSDVTNTQLNVGRFKLTINISPANSGKVNASPKPGNDGKYPGGTVVQLTANENGQYGFVRWEGSAVPDPNNRLVATVAMSGDKTATAVFAKKPSIVVLFPNGGEKLKRNKRYFILWLSFGSVGNNVKIQLIRDNETTTLTNSTANDGVYEWTVNAQAKTGYKIKITSTTRSDIFDLSDQTFQIKNNKRDKRLKMLHRAQEEAAAR